MSLRATEPSLTLRLTLTLGLTSEAKAKTPIVPSAWGDCKAGCMSQVTKRFVPTQTVTLTVSLPLW